MYPLIFDTHWNVPCYWREGFIVVKLCSFFFNIKYSLWCFYNTQMCVWHQVHVTTVKKVMTTNWGFGVFMWSYSFTIFYTYFTVLFASLHCFFVFFVENIGSMFVYSSYHFRESSDVFGKLCRSVMLQICDNVEMTIRIA